MLNGRGDPYSVVVRVIWAVSQRENNLFFDINRQATKHVASPGIEFTERVEHKLVRHILALDDDFVGSGETNAAAAGVGHWDSSYVFLGRALSGEVTPKGIVMLSEVRASEAQPSRSRSIPIQELQTIGILRLHHFIRKRMNDSAQNDKSLKN